MGASAVAPLHGIRILDLSRMLPGGALTRILSDLGAGIVKVERPGAGDEIRADGPPVDGTTATHAFLDRGKRSLALDLKRPDHLAVVLDLVRASDAVVESFRPGVAERLGVGYDALRAVNPRIVLCSVNGFGSGGPRAAAAGHDIGFCARSGMLAESGTRDDGPAPHAAQVADLTGGLLGAVGLLAAVLRARESGVGDHVEVALADAALWSVGIHAAGALAAPDVGRGPESGALNGGAPCYRTYRCADGRGLSVGALEPQFWRAFVGVVGDPDWERRAFDPALVPVVAERVAERSLDAWTAALAGVDACVEPVVTYAEAAEDPQFLARGVVREAEGGGLRLGRPLTTRSPEPDLRPATAVVGGDGAEVLEGLGRSADEVRGLVGGA